MADHDRTLVERDHESFHREQSIDIIIDVKIKVIKKRRHGEQMKEMPPAKTAQILDVNRSFDEINNLYYLLLAIVESLKWFHNLVHCYSTQC